METQWYYTQSGAERKGPISESEIRDLMAKGLLRDEDLLWREGLAAWTPLRELSNFRTGSAAGPSVSPTRVAPPTGLGGWMVFAGITNLLVGIASIISCVGLPVGILYVLAGAALLSGNGLLTQSSGVDPSVLPFLQKLRIFFMMTGIATLVSAVTFILFAVLGLGLGSVAVTSLLQQMNTP